MSYKNSARRSKGKPDDLNEPLHTVIKKEEEAEAGEGMEIETPSAEAELIEIESPKVDEISETEENAKTSLKKKFFSKKNTFEIIRRCLMLACLIIFIISGTRLIKTLIDYKRGADIYGDIADNIFDENLGGTGAVTLLAKSSMSQKLPDYYTSLNSGDSWVDNAEQPEYNMKFEQMKANLNYLKTINPDIYGYIHIEGTKISFPIVQGDDNEYYLSHAYNNEYVVVGSIYADYRADRNIENNMNTIIYGHNMQDGNMFNNVTLFYDEEVFNNTLIEIYTFDGIYIYEPFSIFQTTKFHNYAQMDFETGEEFVAFCELMQRCSARNKGMTFTPDDRIITLSTCTTSPETYFTGRNALHAKLIKVER